VTAIHLPLTAAPVNPNTVHFDLVGQTIAFCGLPPSGRWQTTKTDRLPHRNTLKVNSIAVNPG
jgi:hypothetical protein